MKFFVTIVSLFAAGVLSADAPECAQTCVTQSLSSSDCTSATDYACLCAYVSPVLQGDEISRLLRTAERERNPC